MVRPLLPLLIFLSTLAACFQSVPTPSAQGATLRIGHFPNITHAQALVAHHLSREGKGWFEERLGNDTKIEWFVYNAGPSAMEAIFAESIDLTYVGPNPALNAHIKSRGDEIRIIAGAANGGAALVVQPDGKLSKPADFKGKKIGTPQLGNTQDVAARAWLTKNGLKVTQLGGEAFVLPTQNPDQLSLFARKELDAVWTVEPWVTRLEMESGGRIFLEQKDAITTVLAARARVLKDQAALVGKFAKAHAELTAWINAHPDEAKKIVIAELEELTKAKFKPEIIEKAWSRLVFTTEISLPAIQALVAEAKSVGFLKEANDLSKLIAIPK